MFDQGPQQANHLVGLFQADTGGADLFPQEGHRVQAEDVYPHVQVQAHDAHEFLQYPGIAEIEVHLVVAEGTPYVAGAVGGPRLAQQRRGARSHHLAQVVVRGCCHEVVPAWIDAEFEVLEPLAAAGAVIDHQVGHQAVARCDTLHVVPVAQGFVDRRVVDHREAVVGAPGEERQDMHAADGVGELFVEEAQQGVQRMLGLAADAVAVGDHGDVALVPQVDVARRRLVFRVQSHQRQQSVRDVFGRYRRIDVGIDHLEVMAYALQQTVGCNRHGSISCFRIPSDPPRPRSRGVRRCRVSHSRSGSSWV